jgi:hypothetical protein
MTRDTELEDHTLQVHGYEQERKRQEETEQG